MPTSTIAILGTGNIGTDLLTKALRHDHLDVAAVAGIDPDSDGLARAHAEGVATTSDGVHGLLALPEFADVDIVFDATSARAHHPNAAALAGTPVRLIDLTPAAIGPYVVPSVNLAEHLDAPDVNMVTCGGQATVPIVHAISRLTDVHYAEIVASISSRSAGPGTRANVDEFTVTTSRALEVVGGARHGKAIVVINPSEPPVLMRDTVHCLVDDPDPEALSASIHDMVSAVAEYVPGYRLKQDIQITRLPKDEPVASLVPGLTATGLWQVSVYLEVEGAADYLPAYAGNLDIMTAAAVQVAAQLAPEASSVSRMPAASSTPVTNGAVR